MTDPLPEFRVPDEWHDNHYGENQHHDDKTNWDGLFRIFHVMILVGKIEV